MEFAKRAWTQIVTQTQGMPKQAWMFLIAMTVILLLTLWLVTLYSGQTGRASLAGAYNPADQAAVIEQLTQAGIEVLPGEGALAVAQNDWSRAVAVLASNQMFSGNTGQVLETMIAQQRETFFLSSDQNREISLGRRKQELESIFREVPGVRSANVVIAEPLKSRIGAAYSPPKASVNLTTDGSSSKARLGKVAISLMNGALVGLKPENINVVIDGSPLPNRGTDHMAAGEMFDQEIAIEREKEAKIANYLSFIPGVQVWVDVQLSALRKELRTNQTFKEGMATKVLEKKTISRDPATSGEPGVRANIGATVTAGQAQMVATHEDTTNETQNSQPLLESHSRQEYAGNQIEKVSVSVGVPRSYYEAMWRMDNQESEDPPTTEQLTVLAEAHKAQVEEAIQSQTSIKAQDGTIVDGDVVVQMYVDAASLGLTPQAVGMGISEIAGSQTAKLGLAAVSALGALGILFFMAKKSTQIEELPSYQELAGVPANVPTDDDLIGEVEEGEAEMSGVMVDDATIESRRMAEQITELIKANPDEASMLINKWVGEDDF